MGTRRQVHRSRCYNAGMPGKRLPLYLLPVFTLVTPIWLSSCTSDSQSTPAENTPAVVATATPSAAETSIPLSDETILTIWMPPPFSPLEGTSAGELLSSQLTSFEEGHPDVKVQVRVKDGDGPAGIYEMLRSASLAAPSTLPDIVLLDPDTLQQAVQDDVIVSLNELAGSTGLPGAYEHALAAVTIDDIRFGFPIASEVEVFMYRQDVFDDPPLGWSDLLSGTETYTFPGGESGASFTLAQYISLDGATRDEDGQPTLTTNILREVLEFYSLSKENGLLPLSTLQYASSDQTWDVLRQLGISAAVVPFPTFLENSAGDEFIAQPFPTSDGEGITLANTYVWAILTKDDERQGLAIELINWLMDPEFLGPWAHALGMLPATSASVAHWPDDNTLGLVSQLARVAVPYPDAEIVSLFGPAFRLALEEVLFERSTPHAAALRAAEQVQAP